MATVHIPAHWRHHTGGSPTIEVRGGTLGQVIDAIAREYEQLGREMLKDGSLRSEIAVGINETITENGVLEPIEDTDEIFLLPAIAGG